MKQKILSGIYMIKNIINGKLYIGSAKNIKSRFTTHKRLLKTNCHFNKHLQNSYNKRGLNNFSFIVIENCSIDVLIKHEQYWIDKLKVNNPKFGYNKRLIASSNLGIKVSNETREKLRLSHLGNIVTEETKKKIAKSRIKKVCQIDLDGNYIKTHNSLKDAAKFINIKYATNISACARNKIPSANGYRWCFEKDLKNFNKDKIKKVGWHRGINICVTSLENGETHYFNSLIDASKMLNIKEYEIYNKIKNDKYIWKREM